MIKNDIRKSEKINQLEEFLVVAKYKATTMKTRPRGQSSISSTLEIIEDKEWTKDKAGPDSSDENPETEVNAVNFKVFCDTNPDRDDHDTGRIIVIITMLVEGVQNM